MNGRQVIPTSTYFESVEALKIQWPVIQYATWHAISFGMLKSLRLLLPKSVVGNQ
jgi:hypothetical protein